MDYFDNSQEESRMVECKCSKQLFIALLRQGLDAAYPDPNIHDKIPCLIRPHPFLRSCGPAFSAQHRQDCWLETLGVKEEVPGSSEAATFFSLIFIFCPHDCFGGF